MTTPAEFFGDYFAAEWQAVHAYAKAPTDSEAEVKLAAVDALRGLGVGPRYARSKWDDEDDRAEFAEGMEQRTLFAVSTHRAGAIAVAYTGALDMPVSRGLSVRFAASLADGSWKVMGSQHSCRKCRGTDDSCAKCGGSGRTEWFGEDPGRLGPPDTFQVVQAPTRAASAETWNRLLTSRGGAWT